MAAIFVMAYVQQPRLTKQAPPLQEYYVVFMDAQIETWYTRFLTPGFGHVYLVWHDGYNWIRFQPELTRVSICILAEVDLSAVDSVVLGETAVHIEVPLEEGSKRLWLFAPFTCVEAVKAVLGIRAAHIWTPRQLSRYLIQGRHKNERRRRWWWPQQGTEEAN